MANDEQKSPATTTTVSSPAQIQFSPAYWKHLVKNTYDRKGEPVLGEFGRLQRLNITHLVNNVASIKAAIKHNETTTQEQMDLLREALHQYVEAIRDYKYMSELGAMPPAIALKHRMDLEGAFGELSEPYPNEGNAPYDTKYLSIHDRASQTPDGVREFLRRYLPSFLSWTKEEKEERPFDYDCRKPPEIYSTLLNSMARFLIGTAVGSSLIVPMVIMVFDASITKSLITVSVSLLLFALALAFVFEASNEVIVMATAAYAAVLVVFVGTSTS